MAVIVRMRSVEGSDSERWLGVLPENAKRLAELTDSPDPIAQREIGDALYSRGRALSALGRWPEAMEVWDELLRRLAIESSGGSQRLVLRVLLHKAIHLARADQRTEAVDAADAVLALSAAIDEPDRVRSQVLAALLLKGSLLDPEETEAAAEISAEIIQRFAESDDPAIHKEVTSAIVQIGLLRLLQNRADDAIQMSRGLAQRLANAPEEVLAAEADLANLYGRSLVGTAGTDLRAKAQALAFGSVNVAIWIWRVLVERLAGFGSDSSIKSPRPRGSADLTRIMPTRWGQAHSRIEAAIELQERVVSRIGSERGPELRPAETVARIQIAAARLILGDLRQGWYELNPFLASSDPATIQALQTVAATLRGSSGLAGQLDEQGTLSWLTQAPGQGDTKVRQVAHDDSARALPDHTTYRSIRRLAALLWPDRDILGGLSTKAKAAERKLTRR